MIYIYDVESYPNFFSIAYVTKDGDVGDRLFIYKENNDLQKIVDLFDNKNNWYVGFNSTYYDDRLIAYIMDNIKMLSVMDTDLLTFTLFSKSQEYIDKESTNNEYKWKVPFKRFDLMKVGGIQKSLKLTAVDLRHHRIQDLPYHWEDPLNDEQVEEVLDYGDNDVAITQKLYHALIKEIKLRQELSSLYGLDLMNETRSGIANRILEYHYHKATELWFTEFKNTQTNRESVHLADCIPDRISFKTKNLQDLLENIKSTHTSQEDDMEFNVIIGNTRYDILKGGIHSNMPPEIVQSCDQFKILDADVASYYPRIMINGRIKPAHLDDVFIDLLIDYTDRRLEAKKSGNKTEADGLKIVINSIFGKLGAKYHWLKDILAMYTVTLTGQLSLLMLIEELELNDIEVFYANTDGITAKVSPDKEELYYKICSDWQENNGFELEFEEYEKCIIRDVNNYLWIPKDSDPKYKGFFDINRHEDFTKAFDKPIVAKAIYNFFIDGSPVEETIENHTDIYDFCMAQKVGSAYDVKFNHIEHGRLVTTTLQDTNRYYIGKKGGHIYKENASRKIGIIAGEPVHIANDVDEEREIEEYNIKHEYYIKEANKVLSLFKYKQQNLF